MNHLMKITENGKMKTMKKLITAASVVVLALTGCQEERFEGPGNSDNYFASVETFGSDTKTALGENRSVVWSAEDRIAVFEGSSEGLAYKVLDSYVGKSSGEFAEVEGLMTEGTGAGIGGIIAVYPFNEDLTVTSGANGDYLIEGISFPSEQKYIAGSFSDEAFPMTAVCENGSRNLSFKNIGGVLKLSLTGSYSVSQITLTGNSGEPLSGPATVTLGPDGIPSVTMSDDASTSVTLICDPAVQLDSEKATDFYISIPPTEFENGFTVTVTDENGLNSIKTTNKSNILGRSKILVMPGLSDDALIKMTYDNDYIEGSHSFILSNGNFAIFTPDSLGGYYITVDALDIESQELRNDPIYAQCDSLMRPVFAQYGDARIYFTNYTDNTFDISVYINGQTTDYKGCPFDCRDDVLTKASTEGTTNLDKAGTTLDVLSLAMSYVEDGKKGLLKEFAKQLGMKALPDAIEPWVGWAAGMVEIWKEPKNKLGIAGMVLGTAQAMNETAELTTKLLIGDITPYLLEAKRTDKDAVTVKFGVRNYSNATKDVPMGTIHFSNNYAGWRQGEDHHINGTKEYYEETISFLSTGRYRFRAITSGILFSSSIMDSRPRLSMLTYHPYIWLN